MLAAVHWAFAKFDASRPPVLNIDVNLRNDLKEEYQGMGLLIGMCSVSKVAAKYDFQAGNVSK